MARQASFQGILDGLFAQIGKVVARGVAEGIERSGLFKQIHTTVRSNSGKRGPKPGRRRGTSKTCSIADCDLPARAKGLCPKHYQSERYHTRKEDASRQGTASKKAPVKKKAIEAREEKKTKAGVARRATAKKTSPKKRVPRGAAKKAPANKSAPVATRKKTTRKTKAARPVVKKAFPKKITPAREVNPTPQNGAAASAETKE